MADMQIRVPPIGAKLFDGDEPEDLADVLTFQGACYCEAVMRATNGEELAVRPGSIEICQWSPVSLGLKPAENRFERGISPVPKGRVESIYLARVDRFRDGLCPDVVILRGSPDTMKKIFERFQDDELALEYRHEFEKSALGALHGGFHGWRVAFTHWMNKALAGLDSFAWWRNFTRWIFKSSSVTRAFEALISRTTADMSMCRNSTAIPYITGKANLSFFCSGAIAWGGNSPDNMTSGVPWELFDRIRDELVPDEE